MRLVSWNIRAGGGVRAEEIASQLAAWQPDLVSLCEFRGTHPSRSIALSLKAAGLVHQRTTANPETPAVNSLLVASRWPLRRVRLAQSPDDPHRWLHVIVQAPKPFVVLALHTPNRSSGRKYPFLQSVLDVIQRWRGMPAILMGDTNSGCIGIDEESNAFNNIEDEWIKAIASLHWADAFRLLHSQKREFTWYSPNGRNGFRLDQMFVNPAMAGDIREFSHRWGGFYGEDRGERRDRLSDHAAMVLDASEQNEL